MNRIIHPFLIVLLAGLFACTTSDTRAPVQDLSVGGTQSWPQPGSQAQQQATQPRQHPGPGYHEVQAGETLFRISRMYSQRVDDLAEWNSLADPNQISVGQFLRIWPPSAYPAQPVHTAPVVDTTRDVTPIEPAPAHEPQPLVVVQETPPPVHEAPPPVHEPVHEAPPPAQVTEPAPVVAATGRTRDVSGVVWGWPADGRVIRNFASGQNKGIDIGGTLGQRVVAAADGRVIYSGRMDGYGNLVIIKHNDDLLSAYAHNDSNMVAQGSSVSRGQQVATMGSSGADTVMLHFEVRRQGKPVDPMDYLPSR